LFFVFHFNTIYRCVVLGKIQNKAEEINSYLLLFIYLPHLRKPLYWSHVNGLMYQTMKIAALLYWFVAVWEISGKPTCEWPYEHCNANGGCDIMEVLSICFPYYEQCDWLKSIITNLFLIKLF